MWKLLKSKHRKQGAEKEGESAEERRRLPAMGRVQRVGTDNVTCIYRAPKCPGQLGVNITVAAVEQP